MHDFANPQQHQDSDQSLELSGEDAASEHPAL
jgi:hypothetical protein